MKRMICLLLILCCSMLALSSSALAEGVMGQDVVDSVLRMLEVQFFYGGSTDSAEYFGFPADCVPSDIRVYELVCVASYKNMEQGFFYFIYLTDKGIDLMAESRGVWYIDKVNDALDDYWKYNS